jgi:hypothetical protein
VNRFEVRDSARELDGPTIGDLMFWQLAGCNVCVPVAWALIQVVTAAPFSWTLVASAEAWDANGGSLPTAARTGVGTGTITYAATYPDKDATAITTNFYGADIAEQVLTLAKHARCQVNANKRVVDVALFNLAGAANDWANGDQFLVRVW